MIPLPRLERASDTESEHSEDSVGEKEAKRQRSEPTTPVFTSSRHPYDYDALMGITRVGTKEAEGFEEDLDSAEYHDATEEPVKREDIDGTQAMLKSAGFQGGIGSSSLKECIELLNATVRNSPAPLDSGIGQKCTDPPQVMSPNMEGPLTDANAQPSSGSISQTTLQVKEEPQFQQVKDEPQSRASCDPVMETQPDSSTPTLEVKVEQKESESKEETTTSVKQEERTPEPDSEDSITPERVIEEVHRFLGTQGPGTSAHVQPEAERETAPSQPTLRERAPVLGELGEPGYGPYASQGARHARSRCRSPDPFMFNDSIFLEHVAEASEAQDDPMGQLRSRLMCVEHNIETLRTRLIQVVYLRDTQGIRRDHRTIVARLDEVEEYASANTFQEFMTKIQRLESMLVGTASLDDVRNRMRAQEGNREWSEENSENVSGRENRTTDRRRRRGVPAQGIFRSPMPRTPPPAQTSEPERVDADQQAMQRLFVAYNQCVSRTNHVENRLDQFRHAIQKDALDLALVVLGHDQKVNGHCQELRQLTESVEEAKARINGIDNLAQKMLQHEHHVNQTIDQNTHSQTASIVAYPRTRASEEIGDRLG